MRACCRLRPGWLAPCRALRDDVRWRREQRLGVDRNAPRLPVVRERAVDPSWDDLDRRLPKTRRGRTGASTSTALDRKKSLTWGLEASCAPCGCCAAGRCCRNNAHRDPSRLPHGTSCHRSVPGAERLSRLGDQSKRRPQPTASDRSAPASRRPQRGCAHPRRVHGLPPVCRSAARRSLRPAGAARQRHFVRVSTGLLTPQDRRARALSPPSADCSIRRWSAADPIE